MSWFDTAGFALKTALSTAQKTIDKALDIKEENIVSSTPDVDSFFEAFGLAGQATSLQPRASESQKPTTKEPPAGTSQHSGYWTDAWGSFFETAASLPDVQGAIGPSQHSSDSIPKSAPKPGDAVSSQPQRASLFPGGIQKLSSAQHSAATSKEIFIQSDKIENVIQPSSTATFLTPVTDVPKSETLESCDSTSGNDSSIETLKDSTEQNEAVEILPSSSQKSVDSENSALVCDKSDIKSDTSINDNLVEVAVTTDTIIDSAETPKQQYDANIKEPELIVSISSGKEIIPEDVEALLSLANQSVDQLDSGVNNSEPCVSIVDSFVNLDSNIMINMPSVLLSEVSGNLEEGEPIIDTRLMDPESQNVAGYSDSFHILSASVLQEEGMWLTEETSQQAVEAVDYSPAEELIPGHDTESKSSKEDELEIRECEVRSCDSGGSQEMTHSFVKCSAEEVEDGCHRGQSPLSTTTSDRSDGTKQESEQNTSGDENETTTSSDIEILSAPSGDNGDRNGSPMKHVWVPRSLRARRSDSPSSDGGNGSVPVVQANETFAKRAKSLMASKSLATASSKSGKHLSCCPEGKLRDIELDRLFQHQDELQALLEAREKKVMELNKENLKLMEKEEGLQSQLLDLRKSQAGDKENVSTIVRELTLKVSLAEGEAQRAIKERDLLKACLEEAQSHLARRVSLSEMEDVVKEKDQQIKELLHEGEKLSKKELQHTTIIKKLRAKDSENENTIKSLKEKLDDNFKEVERLRKSMGAKDEQEKVHVDVIRQHTTTINKQEKELASLRSTLEDYVEKELGFKKSLESTYKELTDLHAVCSTKDKEIQELSLSIEMAGKEKLQEGLYQANIESTREKESLLLQIEDLRNSLKRCEEEANLRESALKDDISRLEQRLQESEARNEELTNSISSATRPLVRQIESLQSSYNSQIFSFEKVEKNLNDQLNDCQNQLAVCAQREKLASEKYLELSSKHTKLELQCSALRQEKSQLVAELQLLKSKLSACEESRARDLASIDDLRKGFMSELNVLKDEKDKLGSELRNSLELLKEERQTIQTLQEELRNKGGKLQAVDNASPCPSPSASLVSSVDSMNNWTQEEVPERRPTIPLGSYRMSVYDSFRTGSTTSVLENLQSQLKQRDGEIAQLQSEIAKLEREREAIAQELVEVTTQSESAQEKLSQLQSIDKLYKDLNQRYNTLLQMYGEKVEECDELKLDLTDVKTAYKVQIEELLSAK